jgi:uncharacterized membrane-anchored protein
MSPSQIRSYSRNYSQYNTDAADFLEIIQKIPTLTKMGAICLVMGKFMGVMAIMVAFIPELNILVAPLVIAWGGFVLIAIVLCSTDHFRQKKQVNSKKKLAAADRIAAEQASKLCPEIEPTEESEPVVVIPLAIGQN